MSFVLLEDLRSPSIARSGIVRIAGWLTRLTEGDRARDTFLQSRATLLKRRVKQIKFEDDIGAYVSELAVVIFTIIKNTCEWYMAAFKDNTLASGMPFPPVFLPENRTYHGMKASYNGLRSRYKCSAILSSGKCTAPTKIESLSMRHSQSHRPMP